MAKFMKNLRAIVNRFRDTVFRGLLERGSATTFSSLIHTAMPESTSSI